MRARPIAPVPATILTIAFAALVVGSAPAFGQEPDTRPGIAVLPFDVAQLPPAVLAESGLNFVFSNMLLTELNANPAFRIVDRRALLDVMREFDLVGSPNVDVRTQAELGRRVFARYMVGGNYFDDRGDLRLDVRVINVETTEIVLTARVRGGTSRSSSSTSRRRSLTALSYLRFRTPSEKHDVRNPGLLLSRSSSTAWRFVPRRPETWPVRSNYWHAGSSAGRITPSSQTCGTSSKAELTGSLRK